MAAEVRLGWLRAFNLQGPAVSRSSGPITAVVAAAFLGNHQAGTLMAIYLLAQRVFWGFDGLVDLRLDSESARGAVARCFELIDTPAQPHDETPASARRSPSSERPAILFAEPASTQTATGEKNRPTADVAAVADFSRHVGVIHIDVN